ncbi:MAG TPA: Swt1 family HEPN domain-containing protein, partial [Kamptonema sp.]|nr:Swt1 family HEPN domain-containing protein [Kamptonema sp.]
MAITNHEQVGRALKLLGKGLYPYAEREMQRVHGDGWLKSAKASLSDDYKKRDLAEILRED